MPRPYWTPPREAAAARQFFSTLSGEAPSPRPPLAGGHTAWTPAVDVSETAAGYVFTADLPGMRPEQVRVELKDQTLTVAGERPAPAFGTGVRVRHRERPAGRFARAFRLPKPVDADGVTATYRDGILSITVPPRDAAKRRKIEVQG